MKVYSKIVYQYDPSVDEFVKIYEDSFDYSGPVALAGGGGDDVTQTVEPPAWYAAYMRDLLGAASGVYRGGELGQVAPLTPEQLTSFDLATSYARSPELLGTITSAQRAQQNILQNALDVEQNPAVQAYARAAIRPVEESLLERVLPAIRGSSIQAGQYGGSRQGIAEGQAIGRFETAAGDITSRIMADAYGRGLDATTRALALTPTIAATGTLPAELYGQVGGALQAQEQAELNQPYSALQQYASLIGGVNPGQVTTVPGATTNPWLSALGGGALGATTFSQFGANWGPWGAGIGALLGFLSSM